MENLGDHINYTNNVHVIRKFVLTGEKLPYPGNCHNYYVCFEDGNGSGKFHVEVFSCGEWVYDPNTGSCTWPEEAADDLCD